MRIDVLKTFAERSLSSKKLMEYPQVQSLYLSVSVAIALFEPIRQLKIQSHIIDLRSLRVEVQVHRIILELN